MLNAYIHKPSFLKGVEVGRAIKRLQRVIEQPDIPDTPTQYLYGQIAEATVSYNGVVLPDIEAVWDKETYPYAVIGTSYYDSSAIFLAVGDIDSYHDGKKSLTATSTYPTAIYYLSADGSTWELSASYESGSFRYYNMTKAIYSETNPVGLIWANRTIGNMGSDDTSYFSDPVKSYDADVIIDGVGYKGAVLPPVEETWEKWTELDAPMECPYGIFVRDPNTNSGVRFYVSVGQWVCDGTQVYTSNSKYWCSFIMLGFDSFYGTPWDDSDSGRFNTCYQNADDVFWTSHDILNEDGTVFMSATTPIPVGEMVGYSYNGVVLPELPEWDKTAYPYVYLSNKTLGNRHYFTALSAVSFFTDKDGYWSVATYPKKLICSFDTKNGEFSEWRESEQADETDGASVSAIGWANFDALNEDGSVYLEASEPIPVMNKGVIIYV